jgi:hypothetical protein
MTDRSIPLLSLAVPSSMPQTCPKRLRCESFGYRSPVVTRSEIRPNFPRLSPIFTGGRPILWAGAGRRFRRHLPCGTSRKGRGSVVRYRCGCGLHSDFGTVSLYNVPISRSAFPMLRTGWGYSVCKRSTWVFWAVGARLRRYTAGSLCPVGG